ncbi:hypothetical protein SDC9_94052 [bioreactor metagenome]|uniref:Uncharacterized protein n=1 Tax=bioreactor metagenome TaxID=1076179 RepID=A0A645A908_9ZZZZ
MAIELAQSFDIDKIDGLGAVSVAMLFVMIGKCGLTRLLGILNKPR